MSLDQLFDEIRALYIEKDGSDEEYQKEAPVLTEALDAISRGIQNEYRIVGLVDRGGAGIVLKVIDLGISATRALKIPRPRKGELLESIRNEIEHLKALRHDNLTRIYSAGEVDPSAMEGRFPYFIMDFVEDARDIAESLESHLQPLTTASALPSITHWLAKQVHSVSTATSFLHSHHTLHFDIKPPNILIGANGKPILSDLGFAKRKSADTHPTIVGFTLFYAHPDLRMKYERASSLNRVRKSVAPAEFSYTWDIYALGKTVMHLLAIVDSYFPDAVMYDYTFGYLHLLACRMLDGRNLSKEETARLRRTLAQNEGRSAVYLEHWLTLNAEDLATIKVTDVSEVTEALTKLLDRDYFYSNIPELSEHFPHRVQVAPTAPAPFSPRTKALVEHPVFLRLRTAKQLGIVDTVYPGCSHTRAEHSLGSFRMAWLYVRALIHDPFNPLFRQLVSHTDLKRLLVASLLHDLGQYPLAHEIEDVAPQQLRNLFRHERLTLAWLRNDTQDAEGQTIAQIIEDEQSGWGVPLMQIEQLLSVDDTQQLQLERPNLKIELLRSIVDGPIDVDKLDYLVRDSKRAELPYGASIDVDRLVRNLTVVFTTDEQNRVLLTLGTYEKGQPAAESVTFARYQLYQALYWHHTVRAVRPMIREIFKSIRSTPRRGRKSFNVSFEEFLGVRGTPKPVSVEQLLRFLRDSVEPPGRELVDMILARRLYKRLLTIHSDRDEEGKRPFLDCFRETHRHSEFVVLLQEEILKRFERHMATAQGPKPSVLNPNNVDATILELQKPGRILADCPTPRTGSREKLRFALEPKRRLQNYASRVQIAERVSEVWQQVFFHLMSIASKGRVYCHPDIRDPLMAALGPDVIRNAVRKVVDRLER